MGVSDTITNIETKTQAFFKRHLPLILIILAGIIGIWIFSLFQTDKQEKLNSIYAEMQQKQDIMANVVKVQYQSDSLTPQHLIDLKVQEEVTIMKLSPGYRQLESQAQKLEAESNEYTVFKRLCIGITIIFIGTFMTQVILYLMTVIPFTKMIIKADIGNGNYSWQEKTEVIKLIKSIFITCNLVLTVLTLLLGVWT